MPKHQETRISPYPAANLQALVLDVVRYPEFLPWCKAARILENTPDYFVAELVIAFNGLRESYVSKVAPKQIDGYYEIEVSLVRGPFQHLTNYWRFTPLPGDKGCEISFTLDFTFKVSLLNRLISGFFERATEKMVSAFSARADALYGQPYNN